MRQPINGNAESTPSISTDQYSEKGSQVLSSVEEARESVHSNHSSRHELRNRAPRTVTPEDVTIIVPALNEEQSIEEVVKGLVRSFPDSEIIVVNDGSTDNTEMLASQAGALVISHASPRGYGAALRSGILASTRDFVLFCDADGQHRIEDVARIMVECSNCNMVPRLL